MIEKLTLRNFRGIRNGELELFPITILLGPNNSAKSTLLEAIFLAPNPCRSVPYLMPFGPERSFRKELSSAALDVVYYLHQSLDYRGYGFLLHNYTSADAEIRLDRKIESKYSLRFIVADPYLYMTAKRDSEDFGPGVATIKGEEMRFIARVLLNKLGLETYYRQEPFIEEALLISPKLLRVGYSYLREHWSRVVNLRLARKIAADTSRFSKETYSDFTMEPVMGGHLDINAYLEDGRRIRLADLGEGVQSYAMSRMLYELANPKILLWDDLESHFNPRILGYLADWFNDLVNDERQVVISTHSLEAAKIIAGVNEEQTRIYITSLAESALKTKMLTPDELEKLQKAGIDARIAEDFLL